MKYIFLLTNLILFFNLHAAEVKQFNLQFKNRNILISVNSNMTIRELKKMIQPFYNIPYYRLILTIDTKKFGNIELENDKTCEYYNLDGSTRLFLEYDYYDAERLPVPPIG